MLSQNIPAITHLGLLLGQKDDAVALRAKFVSFSDNS